MAISIVGTPALSDNNGGGTTIASNAKSHTTGNLLVVCVGNETSGPITVTGIEDTASNSYNKVASASGTNDTFEIWYAKNITGNASNVVTATFSGAATYRRITVYEISGCDTTTPFVSGKYSTGTGTGGVPAASSSITPSVADCIIISGTMQAASTTWTNGDDGQGNECTIGPGSTYYATQHIIESSIAAYTLNIEPLGGYSNYGFVAAAFNIQEGQAVFGLNSGTGTYPLNNYAIANKFINDAVTGTLIKLEIYVPDASPTGSIKMAIYEDTDGTNPGDLLLDCGSAAVVDGWVSIGGLSLGVTYDTTYWLTYKQDGGNTCQYKASGGRQNYVSNSYSSSWPDPWNGVSTDTSADCYVMRATVNESEDGLSLGEHRSTTILGNW